MKMECLSGRMPVRCQVCGDQYQVKPCTPDQDGEESTGICAACWPAYEADNRRRVAEFYANEGRAL